MAYVEQISDADAAGECGLGDAQRAAALANPGPEYVAVHLRPPRRREASIIYTFADWSVWGFTVFVNEYCELLPG